MKLSKEMKDLGVAATDSNGVGTSWFRSLPNAQPAEIKKHFGSSFASQRKAKYSNSQHVFILNNNPTWLVTLYMSFGEWRFGAGSGFFGGSGEYRSDPKFLEALQKVQNLIEFAAPKLEDVIHLAPGVDLLPAKK